MLTPSPLEALDELRTDAAGLLDEAVTRGSAAWDVLRGETIEPPVGHRRWPWALLAAVAGAAAGAGLAYALSRLRTTDAPDAVDPTQVEAVIDRAPSAGEQP